MMKISVVMFIRIPLLVALFYSEIIKASDCPDFDSKCKNGECIPDDYFCDGSPDCSDGSDETPEYCIHLKCPAFAFQCAYGACISQEFKCNNIRDCVDNSDESPALCEKEDRIYSRGNCLKNEFRCNSGQCIRLVDACDGKTDCIDGSDETVETCAGRYCPAFAFRCGYGACVNGKAKCNGIQECLDGSDEVAILCKKSNKTTVFTFETPTSTTEMIPITSTTIKSTSTITKVPPSRTDCVVQASPELIVIREATNKILQSGEYVEEFEAVLYKCLPKHILEGPKKNWCLGGNWIVPHSTCTKYCSSRIIKGITFKANCKHEGEIIPCGDYIKPGTTVQISCKRGYRKPNRTIQEYLHCNEFGEWDYIPFRCEPECGTITNEIQSFTLDRSKVNGVNIPWHVAIYSTLSGQLEQICSGTIINARLVLSVANCFWNKEEKSPYNSSLFHVAVGKYFRDYSAQEPLQTHFLNVTDIHIPSGYQDMSLTYQSDIALLVLDRYIDFSSHIKPICIDWLDCRNAIVSARQQGQVAAWGRTTTEIASSQAVRMIDMESINCSTKIIPRLNATAATDKFCTVSLSLGNRLCKGDNGSGFVISKLVNNVSTYFLLGILNYDSNSTVECSPYQFATFTNVQFYAPIIQDYKLRFRPR